MDWHYTGPEAFECKNQIRLSEEEVRQIMDAYTTCAQENRVEGDQKNGLKSCHVLEEIQHLSKPSTSVDQILVTGRSCWSGLTICLTETG